MIFRTVNDFPCQDPGETRSPIDLDLFVCVEATAAPLFGAVPFESGGTQHWTTRTVDGRNPAPVDRWFIRLFIGFQPSKVMQDFFHPQYVGCNSKFVGDCPQVDCYF